MNEVLLYGTFHYSSGLIVHVYETSHDTFLVKTVLADGVIHLTSMTFNELQLYLMSHDQDNPQGGE